MVISGDIESDEYGRQAEAMQAVWQNLGYPFEHIKLPGYNHFTMKELLVPFEQTANTCAMTWLPPFIVHGTHQLDEAAIEVHGEDYRRILIALRKGPLDPQKTRGLARLNEDPHAW